MAEVKLAKLRKTFGTVEVVHGVDIDIRDGEFMVLVGPSGCGKSTLLRMIAGLEDISGGEIFIGGRLVNDLRPKDRDIAMVFQSYALYPHMSVARNMGFSLRMQRQNKAEIAAKVRRAADILGLTPYLDRYPKELSGGQRQRVAMGRAIVRDPQVFLFDEPLSNLDAKLRTQMRSEIKEMHARLGTTTIYVTHDQVEAMTMADRIVVLRDGRIEQVGTPMQLYETPANLFVAGFIGSPTINLLHGSLAASGEALAFVHASGLRLPVGKVPGLAPGRDVICGIRPQHLRLSDDGAEFDVRIVEPTGSETQIALRRGAVDLVGVFDARTQLAPGQRIRIAANPEDLILFDAGTEDRLA